MEASARTPPHKETIDATAYLRVLGDRFDIPASQMQAKLAVGPADWATNRHPTACPRVFEK